MFAATRGDAQAKTRSDVILEQAGLEAKGELQPFRNHDLSP
jgi:hypothetical protein